LLIRFLFAAPSTAGLRRRGDDVRDSRVIHLFIQRRQVFLCNFLDLGRSIVNQRRQLRKLFFLMRAWRGRKPIEVIQKVLHLIRERVGLPFERRPCVPPALILTVYSPGSTSGPRGPNPKPAAMASSCSGVGSAGAFERRSQFVRLTPAAPGPSISRITFPSLSSTVIFTLPSFFSTVSPLASALGFCSAESFLSFSSGLFLAASAGTASLR